MSTGILDNLTEQQIEQHLSRLRTKRLHEGNAAEQAQVVADIAARQTTKLDIRLADAICVRVGLPRAFAPDLQRMLNQLEANRQEIADLKSSVEQLRQAAGAPHMRVVEKRA